MSFGKVYGIFERKVSRNFEVLFVGDWWFFARNQPEREARKICSEIGCFL